MQGPKPTKQQLRQHALDRALAPGLAEQLKDFRPPSGLLSVQQFADTITEMADHFVAYLEQPEPVPPQDQPLLGLATTRELILELHTRGKVVHRGTPIEEDMLALMRTLEHDMETLNYRTVDGEKEPLPTKGPNLNNLQRSGGWAECGQPYPCEHAPDGGNHPVMPTERRERPQF